MDEKDLDYCNIDVQRYRRPNNELCKKPKWRWLLLPLLPISIPIGFAIGLFRGIRNLIASEDLYNRCMRQVRQPTEEEMSIYRDLYEIGRKKVDQERMNDSTHRDYVFDVFLLKPEGKRLILGDLLGRFYSVNSDKIPALALEMFHTTFPERRAVIVKYQNGDKEPQSGDDLERGKK